MQSRPQNRPQPLRISTTPSLANTSFSESLVGVSTPNDERRGSITTASPLTPLSSLSDDRRLSPRLDFDRVDMQVRTPHHDGEMQVDKEPYLRREEVTMDGMEEDDDGDFEIAQDQVDDTMFQPAPYASASNHKQRPSLDQVATAMMMTTPPTKSANPSLRARSQQRGEHNQSSSSFGTMHPLHPQATPTSTPNASSLMDQIVGGSGGGVKPRQSISAASSSSSRSATFHPTAQEDGQRLFNPTPTRVRDTRVASLSSVGGEDVIVRPGTSPVVYGGQNWHQQSPRGDGLMVHQTPTRSHSAMATSAHWQDQMQIQQSMQPQYQQYPVTAAATYDGYLQVQQNQPQTHYPQPHGDDVVHMPRPPPESQRHHAQQQITVQHGHGPSPSPLHVQQMMRSYSDPFAQESAMPQQPYAGSSGRDVYVSSPSHAAGALDAYGTDLTGMRLNVGMGAGIGGVAMESIVGPAPPAAYRTPVRYGPGGALASAGKSYASSSPFGSSSDGSSSARKEYGSAVNDVAPGSARSMTPASSSYSGSGSSYQPSAEKDRDCNPVMSGPNGKSRRGMEEDDGDDDDDDADFVVDQGSPTRASRATSKGGRPLKGPINGRITPNLSQTSATGRPARSSQAPATATVANPSKKSTKGAAASSSSGAASSSAGQSKDEYVPENLPPGERSKEKPPVSYAAIIGQAILASSKKRLSLAQIYAWISAAYPFFRPGDAGWQNSIRHNLSLNECFVKAQRKDNEASGKGSYWMIKPELEYQFEGGNFKKGNGRPKAAPKKKAGKETTAAKTPTPIAATLPAPAPALSPQAVNVAPVPVPAPATAPSQPSLQPLTSEPMAMAAPGPPPPTQPLVMGPYGMIMPTQPSQPVMMPPPSAPVSAASAPQPTNFRKRKASDGLPTPPPSTHSAHPMASSPTLPQSSASVPNLQESPMSASTSTAKRLKLENPDSWSTPAPTTSNRPPPLSRKTSNSQTGSTPVDHTSRPRHDPVFRPPPSSSPVVAYAPDRLRLERSSPELRPTGSGYYVVPSSLLEKAAMRSQRHRMEADDDEFLTPQKPLQTNKMITSSSLSALPHLTPSNSSPVSSPVPPTVTHGGGMGMQQRRSQMYHSATAVDQIGFTADVDDVVKIAGDSSDASDEGESSRVDPKIARRALGNSGNQQRKLQGAAQLGPAVVFATPAVPAKVKQAERLSEIGPEFEHITLSPMTVKQTPSASRVNLPGPSELLSSSPRSVGRRNVAGDRDLLAHLDRAPGSPLGRSSQNKEDFATPGASARSCRIGNMKQAAVTPLRSSAAFNHLNHETPAGLSKLFFKAEHGICDSPNGLLGSCYDMGEPGYLLDQEMDRMQSQTAHSPTGVHAKKGSISSSFGGGWGKMLWETRSP